MKPFKEMTPTERWNAIAIGMERRRKQKEEIRNMGNDEAIEILLQVMPKNPRKFEKEKEKMAFILAIRALKEGKK